MMASKNHKKLSPLIGIFSKWLFLLIIGLYCQSSLAKAIFYQPHSNDASVTMVQWNDLLEELHQNGYREIVIQWTQYGSTNFVTKAGYLKEVLHIAQAKKFKIWLGLYLPDGYYQVMEDKKLASAEFFKSTISKNRRWLSLLEIQSLVNKENFAGWYLPMELTHNYLQQHTRQDRDIILTALKDLTSSVEEKIAVSYFLANDTTLNAAFFDTTLLKKMGLELWLQKGDGLKKHTIVNQLIKKMDCEIGVISENFVQTSDNNAPFEAKKNNKSEVVDDVTRCHKKITFSLRYLPYSQLPLD
jgi:hypothetical protein